MKTNTKNMDLADFVLLDYLRFHSDCYEDFLHCLELATSPHSCCPAFGLLATLGCMIPFTDCTGSGLRQPAQLSLFPYSCAANVSWRRTRSLRQTPLHLPAVRSSSGSSLTKDPFPRRSFGKIPPVSDRGCLRANTFPTDTVMYEIICFLSQTAAEPPNLYRCLFASFKS